MNTMEHEFIDFNKFLLILLKLKVKSLQKTSEGEYIKQLLELDITTFNAKKLIEDFNSKEEK